MLQEDSNGEASFEIIDKKQDDNSNNDKTESLSSISSPYSIPSPGGNLLSNLPPPSNLPDFTFQPVPAPAPLPTTLLPPTVVQPSPQPQFSAAIPPSKGIQHGPIQQQSHESNQGGFIGWMKDAVSTGGILSKVAEKAKNSVDTLITTLDPQMSEFIYSGGDIEISVASQDPDEITPIREAIFAVFGKAWVNGISIKIEERKHQALGLEEGSRRADEKLKVALLVTKNPVIAIENILLQEGESFFDLSVILLKDSEKDITLKTYTQTTPIPGSLIKQAEKEMPSYAKGCDSPEKLLSAFLHISKNNWQHDLCGVSKKETLFLAAKTLVTLYKNKLVN